MDTRVIPEAGCTCIWCSTMYEHDMHGDQRRSPAQSWSALATESQCNPHRSRELPRGMPALTAGMAPAFMEGPDIWNVRHCCIGSLCGSASAARITKMAPQHWAQGDSTALLPDFQQILRRLLIPSVLAVAKISCTVHLVVCPLQGCTLVWTGLSRWPGRHPGVAARGPQLR